MEGDLSLQRQNEHCGDKMGFLSSCRACCPGRLVAGAQVRSRHLSLKVKTVTCVGVF